MTPATNSRPTIHIALELSVTSWVIAYRLPGSDKIKMHRMSAGATKELLAVVSDLRGKAAARIGGPRRLSPVASKPGATGFGCVGC